MRTKSKIRKDGLKAIALGILVVAVSFVIASLIITKFNIAEAISLVSDSSQLLIYLLIAALVINFRGIYNLITGKETQQEKRLREREEEKRKQEAGEAIENDM